MERLKSSVSRFGDIIEFKMFSDISISLVIEISENKMERLYLDLKTYLSIDDFKFENTQNMLEVTVYLNLSFSNGTGGLMQEIPAVPG